MCSLLLLKRASGKAVRTGHQLWPWEGREGHFHRSHAWRVQIPAKKFLGTNLKDADCSALVFLNLSVFLFKNSARQNLVSQCALGIHGPQKTWPLDQVQYAQEGLAHTGCSHQPLPLGTQVSQAVSLYLLCLLVGNIALEITM